MLRKRTYVLAEAVSPVSIEQLRKGLENGDYEFSGESDAGGGRKYYIVRDNKRNSEMKYLKMASLAWIEKFPQPNSESIRTRQYESSPGEIQVKDVKTYKDVLDKLTWEDLKAKNSDVKRWLKAIIYISEKKGKQSRVDLNVVDYGKKGIEYYTGGNPYYDFHGKVNSVEAGKDKIVMELMTSYKIVDDDTISF